MGIDIFAIAFVAYLLVGSIFLVIFDATTKRIRSKFTQATGEMQSGLARSGNFVGGKWASTLFLGAIWLFWPAVFIGALTDNKKKDGN